MRRLAPVLAVLGLVALPLIARAATTHPVAVGDDFFNPAQLQLDAGDTVRWTNEGLRTHTVTFSGEPREDLLPTRTRETTFRTAGTYRYRCEYHPATMQGSLVVRGSASTSSTSTTRATTTSTTQDPRASAVTAPPDTSTTTTTTTTTTTVVEDTTTTTMSTVPGGSSALDNTGEGGDPDDVDGPGAVAALLLLVTAGGTFAVTRRAAL